MKLPLLLFSVLRPLGVFGPVQAAEDDEDSIESIKATRIRNGSDANPEIKDFVGGVYEGKAGSYWISGNNIFTPDGQCIRKVGNNYFTPEGNYRKVGNTYFKPDGEGAVVRSGNTFLGDGSATIKSGDNYFRDGTTTRAVGIGDPVVHRGVSGSPTPAQDLDSSVEFLCGGGLAVDQRGLVHVKFAHIRISLFPRDIRLLVCTKNQRREQKK